MITEQEYLKYKSIIRAHNEYISKNYKVNKDWLFLNQDTILKMKKELGEIVTNTMRSEVEIYEFMVYKPDKYFAYIDEKANTMTTWMGDVLGTVTFLTDSTRPSILVKAINGITYKGSYYKKAGDYCRIKAI